MKFKTLKKEQDVQEEPKKEVEETPTLSSCLTTISDSLAKIAEALRTISQLNA